MPRRHRGLAQRLSHHRPGGRCRTPGRYPREVFRPAPASDARRVRRLLAMAVGLALLVGLTCAVVAVAASGDRSDTMGMPGHSASAGAVPRGSDSRPATAHMASAAVSAAPGAMSEMTSMCPDGCPTLTTGVLCATVIAFVVTGMAALLLASIRTPFLGLLARVQRPGLTRRRLRLRTPWLDVSPVSLCVFRV